MHVLFGSMAKSLAQFPVDPLSHPLVSTFVFFFGSFLLSLFYSFESFPYHLMDFPWSLSDSKFPQVSRTLLSILVNLSNAVVWLVSSYPLISKYSRIFINPLGIAPIICVFTWTWPWSDNISFPRYSSSDGM